MQQENTIFINSTTVECVGDEELTHPKIYLKCDPKIGMIVCHYCARKFVLNSDDGPH